MKTFYKNQAKIVIMMILTLFSQVIGPVAGFVYADEVEGKSFQVVETTINGSKATIDWVFTLNPGETTRVYNDQVEFALVEEKSGELFSDDGSHTKIGNYRISEMGEISVEIDEAVYETFKEHEDLELDDYTSGSAIEQLAPSAITFTGSFEVNGVVIEPVFMALMGSEDPVSFNDVVLEHVDASGNPVSGDFQVDSHVKIKFNYTIEDRAQVDTSETYEFTIPKEIPIISDFTMELKDGARVLANILITKDPTNVTGGFMTVQFLDEINNEDFDEERQGWIEITSRFGNVQTGDGGDKTITFEVNGVSKDITVKFEEVEAIEVVVLEKSGNYDKNKNEITWTIRVKPTTTPAGRTVKDIVITDIIEAGQTYIPGTAKLGNAVISPDPVSGSTLSYTFSTLQDGANQTITFKTKADLSKFINQGDTVKFENTVTGRFGEENTPTNEATASVSTTVNFISKTGSYDAITKKINWKVEVNNNNLALPPGVTVKDTIGAGLEYDNDLKIDGNSIATYGSLSIVGQELTFTFANTINTKHRLTYSTKVIDPNAYNSNTAGNYYNKAEITWSGKSGGPTSTGDIGVGVSTSVISKEKVLYNALTREIVWRIVVNNNEISITNPVVTDTLPSELEYVSHTTSGSTVWGFSDNTGDLTFSHTGTISERIEIMVTTKIKDTSIKSLFGHNGTKDLVNKVKLTGTGVNSSNAEARQQISSQVIGKSARGYDYSTRKVKWEIVVNQNNKPITNAVVTDTIQGTTHEFVAGSLMLNGAPLDPNDYTVSGKTITINLGNITVQQSITFETQIPVSQLDDFFKNNGEKKLKNKAKITGTEIKDGGVEVEATQRVQNTVISKKGNYESGTDFIDWEVIINSNGLTLSNVILEDILQEGLILDLTSVKVNRLSSNSDGTYTEGPELSITTTYDSATNEVLFTVGDISDAYILRFRTDVDDEYNNTRFKNTIKLHGSNGEQNGVSTVIGVNFQTGAAGGSGSSTKGSLTIVKLDQEMPLSGAKFELYKEDKTTLLETSNATYESGTVVFGNLRMGQYYIKEIQAPTGYVLDDELKPVELKKGADTKHVTYEFENHPIKGNIELYKRDKAGKILPGAEFSLYYQLEQGGLGELVARVESDENGLVRFEDIPYGDYVVKETMAPLGYEPSSVIQTVEIRENGQTMVLRDVINQRIIGDLEIIKISGDGEESQDEVAPMRLRMLEYGETLEGAEFELRNEENVYTGTTDENGRIVFNDIEFGIYTLTEMRAPRGYILRDRTYEVEISEYNQEIIRLVIENQRIKGSLEILKVDNRTERPLRNAVFTLYDKNMNKIEEVTTGQDGKAVFDDLEYGKYFYEETRAPGGYYIDRTIYELDIPENENQILEDGFVIEKTFGNRRRPDDPEEPTNPTDPTDPIVPEEPTVLKPDIPDDMTIIDGDEIPLGTPEITETPGIPDETPIYLDENLIPLGGPQTGDPLVPKTGDNTPVLVLIILFVISLLGAITLIVFRRKRFNQ